MKIKSIAYRVPSKKLDNDDTIDYIDRRNPHLSSTQKALYLKLVKKLLVQTGAETRYWRDFDAGEKAGDLILSAMDEALEKANMSANDIDLLIYCGVERGFLEPANAYFYAKAKGMRLVNCFDITDACMSWIRALHIAYLMLRSQTFKTVMVINGEFHGTNMERANWEIRHPQSLTYTFPQYTIGEAATATILIPSQNPWTFSYLSRPEYADLCTIPLNHYRDFVEPNDNINLNGIDRFTSFGKELFQAGSQALVELFSQTITDSDRNVLYFPHAASKTVYEKKASLLDVPSEKVYLQVYPRFGNLVSASIPVGLCLAREEGKLKEGDAIALVPVSAGLVASVVQLIY